MPEDPYTVAIARGEGLVARFGDVVMYIADETSSAVPVIAAAEAVADMALPGTAIADALAPLSFSTGLAAAFGVVAPTADGLLVLLRGSVTARVATADGTRELSGSRALTWYDETVPTGAGNVAVTIGPVPGVVGSAHTDLRSGVVPGGGFVLQHVGAAAPQHVAQETMMRMTPTPVASPAETAVSPIVSSPAETAVSPAASPAETSVPPIVASPAETAISRVVSPAETAVSRVVSPAETAVSRVVSPAETAISRVVSPAETAASPAASPASPAETAVSQAVPVPASPAETAVSRAVAPPRHAKADTEVLIPAQGALISEDDDVYPLDRNYVIGRDPMSNATVRNSGADAIIITDNRHVSRVHAHVTIVGGMVFVRDAMTPGGTYIAPAGSTNWTQIGAGPTELKPGWAVQVGEQTFTYRTD